MKKELRKYQQKALDICRKYLNNNDTKQNKYIVMPTGTGKTEVFKNITNKKILILVDKTDLRDQTACRFADVSSDVLTVGSGTHLTNNLLNTSISQIVVATVQTLVKDAESKLFNLNTFELVVIDECQHTAHDMSYKRVLDCLTYKLCLGFTATPPEVSTVFDSKDKLYEMTIFEAWKDGWLAKPELYHVELHWDEIQMQKTLAKKNGDFTDEDLDRALEKYATENFELVLNSLIDKNNAERSCVYWPSIKQAESFAEYCNNKGYICYALSARTSRKNREFAFKQFKENRNIILSNVRIIQEGIDLPEMEVEFIARPTRDPSVAKQTYGRVLRQHPDKRKCIIIEGTISEHNYLCQQTFETCYLLSDDEFVDEYKLSNELKKYLEDKINNNDDIEQLKADLSEYTRIWYSLVRRECLYINTYNIDNYFYLDKEKTKIAGHGEIVKKQGLGRHAKISKTYINYRIDTLAKKMLVQCGRTKHIVKYKDLSECFRWLSKKYCWGDDNPFNNAFLKRKNQGSRTAASPKQLNMIQSMVQELNVLPDELAKTLSQQISLRDASAVIGRLLCLNCLETIDNDIEYSNEENA